MKLDGENVHCPSLAHKPAIKTIGYDVQDDEWTEQMVANNEIIGTRKHATESVLEGKISNMDMDKLPCEKFNGNGIETAGGSHNYMKTEDSICGCTNVSGAMISSDPIPTSEKDIDLYTNKTVTEVELSKSVVYSKDNYIKDICCIDERVPSLDKLLVEYGEVGQKRLGILQSELDNNSDLTKEVHSELPISDCLKLLVFSGQLSPGVDEELDKSSTESLVEEGEWNVDATEEDVNNLSNEEAFSEESLLVPGQSMGSLQDCSSISARNDDQQPHDQEQLWNAVDSVDIPSKAALEEATSASSPAAAAKVFDGSCDSMDLPIDSKAEGGRINVDFDHTPPEMSIPAESTENADCQQSVQNLSASLLNDDGALDSLTGSTRSFFTQNGLGESSVSEMGSVSGQLAYSGAVPYSGSSSFRSDSSTTSTRSFAFPILHPEWNESPMKMAKADRRQLRRHRGCCGWKVALLCCRF